jgi:NAD(P)H-hydrate epimerase
LLCNKGKRMKLPSTRFLKRKKDSHKGDFGHVFIIAGSRGLTGAACLCAQAALRSGAGLVTVGIPKSVYGIVAAKLMEVMVMPLPETGNGCLGSAAFRQIKAVAARVDVLALGPGLSKEPQTQRLVRNIVKEIGLPMVIDADGLNAMAGAMNILVRRGVGTIITPHPGEMARLAGISSDEVQKNRTALAKKIASKYNIITILKGHRTVVSSPEGKTFINTTGNPGMSKAGTGDALTGIIAAFLAQGATMFDAAVLAVHVHGMAADIAVQEKGELSLLASDIINVLPRALREVCGEQEC